MLKTACTEQQYPRLRKALLRGGMRIVSSAPTNVLTLEGAVPGYLIHYVPIRRRQGVPQ